MCCVCVLFVRVCVCAYTLNLIRRNRRGQNWQFYLTLDFNECVTIVDPTLQYFIQCQMEGLLLIQEVYYFKETVCIQRFITSLIPSLPLSLSFFLSHDPQFFLFFSFRLCLILLGLYNLNNTYQKTIVIIKVIKRYITHHPGGECVCVW